MEHVDPREQLRYTIPLYRLAQAGWYMARNKPRNLGEDFRFLRSRLPTQPRYEGTENVPTSGAFVLVANHYERPGLWMGWSGLIIAGKVYELTRRRVRFIAIAEWQDYKIGFLHVPPGITRFLFARFFYTFGFIPMEPEGAGPHARSVGVRAALKAIDDGEAVCIFPEGNIGSTPAMIAVQRGSMSFVVKLASRGARIVPVSLFEERGVLHVCFGAAVELDELSSVPIKRREEVAERRIMGSLSRMLPEAVRGHYADVEPTGRS